MELSHFAAIIGFLELVVGIPLLVSPGKTSKWITMFIKNDTLTRFTGGLAIMLCGPVLLSNHTIGSDISGLIVLIAWLGAFKGLVYAWWPEHLQSLAKKFLDNSSAASVGGLVAITLGILLLYASAIV